MTKSDMFRTLWIQVWFYYCKNKKIKMYAWYTFIRHIRWTTNIECLAYNCIMGKSTLAVETCVRNREIQNIIEWVYWKESKEVTTVSVLWLWLTNHWMTGFCSWHGQRIFSLPLNPDPLWFSPVLLSIEYHCVFLW